MRWPVVLFAMEEERKPFLDLCRRCGIRTERPGRRHARVVLGGRAWDVALTGAGEAAALRCLSRLEPSEIVHAGFAGALRPDLSVGDTARIVSVRKGPEVLEVPRSRFASGMSHLAPARLVTAPAPLGASDKRLMHSHDAGDLVDMESHAVLACALEEGIPYTGLRIVSDALDDELPEAVLEAWDGEGFRRSWIFRRALTRWGLAGELLELRRRCKKVAEMLAEHLLALLTAQGSAHEKTSE